MSGEDVNERKRKRIRRGKFWGLTGRVFALGVIDNPGEIYEISVEEMKSRIQNLMNEHRAEYEDEWLEEMDVSACAEICMRVSIGTETLGDRYAWYHWCCNLVEALKCAKSEEKRPLICKVNLNALEEAENALKKKTEIPLAALLKEDLDNEVTLYKEL